jgi:hypothetical protein
MSRFSLAAVLATYCVLCLCSCHEPRERRNDNDDDIFGNYKQTPTGVTDPQYQNVRVDLERVKFDSKEESGFEFLWRVADEGVVAGNRRELLRKNGIRVGVCGDGFRAELNAYYRKSRMTDRMLEFIVVGNGYGGMIEVGEIVPRHSGFVIWDGRMVMQTYDLVRATARLEVGARILGGGMIELTLTPQITNYDKRTDVISLTDLATKVTVRDGQPLLVGGMSGQTDTFGGTFFGSRSEKSQSRMALVVTASVMK